MAAPLILRLTLGPAATDALIALKSAFARHSRVVMSAVLLGLGLFVMLNAVADLLL
jgi:cadmium resistance protein CadD (predicted permease)